MGLGLPAPDTIGVVRSNFATEPFLACTTNHPVSATAAAISADIRRLNPARRAPTTPEKESRPIVWPSARMQQEALDLSPSQVKEINRCLIELGLVTMKDSPNGKRYGKRDPKGRINEAR
jgi:hypothetical protein